MLGYSLRERLKKREGMKRRREEEKKRSRISDVADFE